MRTWSNEASTKPIDPIDSLSGLSLFPVSTFHSVSMIGIVISNNERSLRRLKPFRHKRALIPRSTLISTSVEGCCSVSSCLYPLSSTFWVRYSIVFEQMMFFRGACDVQPQCYSWRVRLQRTELCEIIQINTQWQIIRYPSPVCARIRATSMHRSRLNRENWQIISWFRLERDSHREFLWKNHCRGKYNQFLFSSLSSVADLRDPSNNRKLFLEVNVSECNISGSQNQNSEHSDSLHCQWQFWQQRRSSRSLPRQ